MSITFDVADVEKGTLEFEVAPFKKAAEIHLRHIKQYFPEAVKLPGYIQKFGCTARLIHPHKKHNFFATVFAAYNHHLPLSLSPDHIWTLIVQGLAQHIHAKPEKYRHLLVEHEGRKSLVVEDHGAKLESEENNWEGFVDAISSQIAENIGSDNYKNLVPEFTTTTLVDMLVHKIGLMDSVSDFFKYIDISLCGIPQITLEGEPDDWMRLMERTEFLNGFGLEDWQLVLAETLSQFYEASKGHVDLEFWNNIINEENESGGPYVSGWILNFLNYYCDSTGLGYRLFRLTDVARKRAMTWQNIPANMSCVPVTWQYYDSMIELDLYAGCFGMSQAEDLTLRPELGWLLKRSPRQS